MDCNNKNRWLTVKCQPIFVIKTTYSLSNTNKQAMPPSNRYKIRTNYLAPSTLTLIRVSLFILTIVPSNILITNQIAYADDSSSGEENPQNEVDACEACRLVVRSFDKGMEVTARGKHEGGDTSWEERNLKSYTDSEVRLVEIQEQLCEEVKKGKAQCLSLAEDSESDIEHWWFKQRNKNVRLFDFLCISKLKRCCPAGKFGPNCQACDSDCNKHGVCDGAGTRQGTGKCDCEIGYIDAECASCADDHFRIATSDHFTCRKCDTACKGCYGPGQTNCTECREGYYRHDTNGCIDINECDIEMDALGVTKLCKKNQYCVNTDGAYRCADCHVACSDCVGYGPDMCIACAPGYKLDDEYHCRSEDEPDSLNEWTRGEPFKAQSTLARYLFYLGVLTVSALMFRSNLYVMYTFSLGFVVLLLITEFDLLDGLKDDSKVSSE